MASSTRRVPQQPRGPRSSSSSTLSKVIEEAEAEFSCLPTAPPQQGPSTDAPPFVCQPCLKRFSSLAKLRGHISAHHPPQRKPASSRPQDGLLENALAARKSAPRKAAALLFESANGLIADGRMRRAAAALSLLLSLLDASRGLGERVMVYRSHLLLANTLAPFSRSQSSSHYESAVACFYSPSADPPIFSSPDPRVDPSELLLAAWTQASQGLQSPSYLRAAAAALRQPRAYKAAGECLAVHACARHPECFLEAFDCFVAGSHWALAYDWATLHDDRLLCDRLIKEIDSQTQTIDSVEAIEIVTKCQRYLDFDVK